MSEQSAIYLAGSWTVISTGFPPGWTGYVKIKRLADPDLIFLGWSLEISGGTVLSGGEPLTTLPDGTYYEADNRYLTGNLTGGGQSNLVVSLAISPAGVLAYQGPGYTVAGTSYLYGQGVFSSAQ